MVEPATQYDNRMLDSLGSQKYTEQQMLHIRKLKSIEHDLDALDDKRKALESSFAISQLEAGAGKLQASDSEAVRMGDYASAAQASQTRIAQGAADHAVQQSVVENDRDRKLMQAELEANRRLTELDQKYTSSIQGASSESEKSRIRAELEVEKAKAEAQRKKAMIEANSTLDLSRLEQTYRSRIEDAKSSASALSHEVSQESQKQRIKVALANAESQRRLKDDIASTQASIATLLVEKQASTQALRDQISKISEQIAVLQGREKTIDAGYASKIDAEQSRLENLNGQSQQLEEVEQSLLNSPILAAAQGADNASSRDVIRLESEIQQARSDLLVQKSNQLAQVDQELSHDLDQLSTRMSTALASNPIAGGEVTAKIEKTANESAIRNELASKRTQINNDARSQLAELTVRTEIAKAGVVAPVVTSRAVYAGTYGDNPQAFAVRESSTARELVAKAKAELKPVAVAKRIPAPEPIRVEHHEPEVAPLLVAASFEPRAIRPALSQVDEVVVASGVMSGGDLKPLVIAPAATSYSVIYGYAEKGSADRAMAYMRAYGVTDFTYSYSQKLGQHILFMGKYTSKEQAANRVASLNKTTNTTNAKIVELDL
ncbi:hypothetical protein GIW05_00950 [Pseudomonas syringae]|uniref:hypothetical protein n=3 Tax=Pseudomonas syringae TaxID=317 RepID=UPI001F3F54D6|nr:hypothetical protein [Pseudomonas syringae]MCF5382090.1 hypothetical protein [Pseudomonas syringae]MCF5419326.1 hypothetical protein [Pseudomonas syringae]